MTNPLLSMTGVSKRFPGVTALDDASLQIDGGEVVALVGENGAGKSTLMRILAGIEHQDAGVIRIQGEEVFFRAPRDAASRGISIIHQELELIDTLDIAGNMFLGREFLRRGPLRLIDRKLMDAACEVHLKRLGLARSPRTLVAKLSTAEMQLVEIAKALSVRARLLIMDEPTSSLTAAETDRLLSIVRELKAQGVAIIYISHRMAEIEDIADRVVVLRDGRNVGTLNRAEIQRQAMVRLMVGRDLAVPVVESGGNPTAAPFLEVKAFRTQRYPQHTVNLDVHRGEILGLAGLVGAGRSELLRAIFGAEAPVSGSLSVDGAAVTLRSPKEAIAKGIYMLPEDRRAAGLLTNWSIRKNITLPRLWRFAVGGLLKASAERAIAAQLCDQLKVKTTSIESRAALLSGGNQQKVVLAKGLSIDPRIFLFDEPTRGVDVGSKDEIHALMRRLARDGAAVVVASSDLEEILGVTDRIAVMREGRITGVVRREQYSAESVMQLAVAE